MLGQEAVGIARIAKETGLINHPIVAVKLDRNTLHQKAVKAPVFLDQPRILDLPNTPSAVLVRRAVS
jgi:hypothetical protein